MSIIENSLKLESLKTKIIRTINDKHESNMIYQNIILQYIIETALNIKIKNSNNSIFQITYYDEFLDDHYRTDKQILISYNLSKKKFTIERSGKEFSSLIGKEIEELFAFDKYAMYHFERKIKEMKEKENLM